MMPGDDASIGSILLALELITEEQLEVARQKQQQMRDEAVLGLVLVNEGYITKQQLDIALAAQDTMRSNGKHGRALGIADIALYRHNQSARSEQRARIAAKSTRVVRAVRHVTSATYPAVTEQMLAKNSAGD